MDILTLELLDVTVSQVLAEARRALERHPGLPLRLVLGSEETLRHNLVRFLEREGHGVRQSPLGALWQLDVRPAPTAPEAQVAAVPVPIAVPLAKSEPPIHPEAPRALLLLHAGFPGGDPGQGRRLLLEVLARVAPPTPFLALAHGAVELLEDPAALRVLEGVQRRGVPVRLSREALLFHEGMGFEEMADAEWQALLARGALALV